MNTATLRLYGASPRYPNLSQRPFRLSISTTILPVNQRNFHASPPQHFIAECVDQTQHLIVGLHTLTGLPWAAALPLTAILIRLGILGPLAAYAHIKSYQRREIYPLIYAWEHAIRRKVLREHGAQGPAACHKLATTQLRQKGRELRKELGVQYWKSSLSWLQLPVFLVVIESIRKMCGTHSGLLGLLTRGPGEDATREEILAGTDMGVSYEIKQSLATEGALWFPDLLLPDPALILPFMLSGCLFANIMFHDRKAAAAGIQPGKWQLRFQRSVKVVALAIGPATLGVPSAMLVYWITSSVCALGQNYFLEWYLPTKPIVKPCKQRGSGLALGGSPKT
jgi:inner membrane protein COX18